MWAARGAAGGLRADSTPRGSRRELAMNRRGRVHGILADELVRSLRFTIADEIESRMSRVGMSERELARQIGATPSTVSKILGAQRTISTPYLVLVSQALGCSPNDLLEWGIEW